MPYPCSRTLLLAFCLLLGTPALAGKIVPGQAISPLVLQSHGELVLDTARDEVVLAPWSSSSFEDGRHMHAVLYMAASMSAGNLNRPFFNSLGGPELIDLQPYIQVTSIVYIPDGIWGGPELALGTIRYNKRKNPHVRLVADANGQGLTAWDLKPDSSAVTLLDPTGKVLFFKEGAMSAEEITHAVNLLRQGAEQLRQQAAAPGSPTPAGALAGTP